MEMHSVRLVLLAPGRQEIYRSLGAEQQSSSPFPTGAGCVQALENGEEEGEDSVALG